MPPVKGNEVVELFSSLSDVIPFLSPAKAILDLIIAALEKVEDNTYQCSYLLHRCLNLYVHVHDGCCNGIINAGTYSAALLRFRTSLEKIHLCMVEISRKTPLQRLFQRHEISDSVRNAHSDLDGCLELFHVEAATSLIFIFEEHEDARVRDQAQLNATLTQLLRNDVDILTNLDLRTDQIMEAIRGLQNTLKRGVTDSVQEKFAEDSLQLLRKSSYNTVQPSYEWAISSLEIFVEGEVIGSGAFGTVHSGRWNGSRVAVKKLARGTPRQTLIREIEIWRKMQHPHVASFFRACIDAHPPLIVSELYQYGNVVQYISQFPDCNRLKLCYQISLGMQFLHAEKVVHGDLKPANVLIDDSHRARIADFGLSRVKTSLTTQTSADVNYTTVRIPGTKAFMAPERLLPGKNNFKTDVYAWGMSAYQIFCDEAPFQYLPEEDLRSSIIDHGVRPERPDEPHIVQRGLTDNMWNLLERSWAQDYHQRPEFQEISNIISSSIQLGDRDDGHYADLLAALSANSANPSRNSLSARSGDSNQTSPLDQNREMFPAAAISKTEVQELETSTNDPETSLSSPSSGNANLTGSGSTISVASQSMPKDNQKIEPVAHSKSQKEESKRKRPWSQRRIFSKSGLSSVTEQTSLQSVNLREREESPNIKDLSSRKLSYPRELKITIVGSGGCGKTSLLFRFSTQEFYPSYDPTIEEYYKADISIAGSRVLLDLTDTAGQEEYASLLDFALQKAELAIIAFSITSESTLQNVSMRFVPQLRRVNKSAPMILVGLKSDLRGGDLVEVSRETGEAVAKQYGVPYLECSALTGEGVREVFETATKVAMEAARSGPPTPQQASSSASSTTSGCIIS